MRKRLTKFITVLLTFMFVVGMSPGTTTTSYAASKWGSSISSWLNGLKNQNASKKEDTTQKEDTTAETSTTLGAASTSNNDTNPNDALNLSKSISKDKDGNYTINLEAYATGKVDVSTETKAKPTDIVLVLDQSASMLDALSTTTYEKCNKTKNTDLYNTDNLYVKVGDNYYEVTVKEDFIWDWIDSYYQYTYSYKNKTDTIKVTSNYKSGVGPSWDFYTKETVTKEQALKTAVTQFVNSVQQQAKDNKVDYRIAIVGYGNSSRRNSDENYKNTEILSTQEIVNYSKATNDNYKDALVSANVNGSLNTRISTAIDRIIVESNTATSADHGMDMAKNVLANNTSTDRNKVVVMFTDGEPNHGNGFDSDVANTTIGTSKTIKNTYKSKVYTVGILSGANPDDTSSDINKYMNYVSSNYPNASKLNNGGTGSNQGYYMNATNSSQLNNIFEKISSDIETPSTSVTLNGKSVLKDIISDNFNLPDNVTTSDIKVFTADFNGKDASGNYTWKAEQKLDTATVSIDNKTVNVSGFDYSKNYAVTTSSGNSGKKLIVKIPVNIVRTFGGNNIPSNENTSGIYESSTSKEAVKKFVVPEVDAAIDYKIEGTQQWINEGESVTLDSLIGYAKDGNFEYKADGKKNKFVDLTYTIKDEKGNVVGTYTIKAGETSGTISGNTGALDVDTEYTVECTVKPITEGTTKETKVENAISHVYVRGVDKAFIIDFAKPVTYTKDKVFTKNQISSEDKVNAISKADATDTYGNLALNNDKSITYSLNKFMDGIDTYKFNVATKAGTQTVKMVPGSSVYYEDNFKDEDGNTIIQYDGEWTEETNGKVINSIRGDNPVGYDENYKNTELEFSSGSIHKVEATNSIKRATFTFKGTGFDLYSFTSGKTGQFTIQVYAKDGNGEFTNKVYGKTINTKYNSGEAYQVPVVKFNSEDTKSQEYLVKITIPMKTTFYLDAIRIYNPIGNNNNEYGEEENNVEYVSIREQSLEPNKFSVVGNVFIDKYLSNPAHSISFLNSDGTKNTTGIDEYTKYGRKNEVVVAPGKSITIKLNNTAMTTHLGARIDASAPSSVMSDVPENMELDGKVYVNENDLGLNSSTDMYYKVIPNNKNEITIVNKTNKLIALTNLKLK